MALGWGDHEWGPDPWGGCPFPVSSVQAFILYWDDDEGPVRIGPKICHRYPRPHLPNDPPGHALCSLFPEFMCLVDLNPHLGGDGTWHRLLAVLYDFLYGSAFATGFLDDIASLTCIVDVDEAPDKFLDALLLQYGFNLQIRLTTAQKRKILLLLIDLYKRKGTKQGIEDALRVFLGIAAEIICPEVDFRFFEMGEDASRTLTDLPSGGNSVRVTNIERFEVGENIVITDDSGGDGVGVPFEDTPITQIVGDRVFFDPQVLSGTIPAGAVVFCDRLCDQIEDDVVEGGCAELGIEQYDPNEPGLYTFFVDIQRTVFTAADLPDGGESVELTSVDFVNVDTRLRIDDTVIVTILSVDRDTNEVTFDPVSLDATILTGAPAINLFNAEELLLISRIVEAYKTAHTHHVLTRDIGEFPAEVG